VPARLGNFTSALLGKIKSAFTPAEDRPEIVGPDSIAAMAIAKIAASGNRVPFLVL
jgi:hypothetical protein